MAGPIRGSVAMGGAGCQALLANLPTGAEKTCFLQIFFFSLTEQP